MRLFCSFRPFVASGNSLVVGEIMLRFRASIVPPRATALDGCTPRYRLTPRPAHVRSCRNPPVAITWPRCCLCHGLSLGLARLHARQGSYNKRSCCAGCALPVFTSPSASQAQFSCLPCRASHKTSRLPTAVPVLVRAVQRVVQ